MAPIGQINLQEGDGALRISGGHAKGRTMTQHLAEFLLLSRAGNHTLCLEIKRDLTDEVVHFP